MVIRPDFYIIFLPVEVLEYLCRVVKLHAQGGSQLLIKKKEKSKRNKHLKKIYILKS